MNTPTFLTQLRDLIARDELPTALERLRTFLDNSPQLDEVLLQSARFQDIRRQIRLGLVSPADANLNQQQIRSGLLELLHEIERIQVAETNEPPSDHALTNEMEKAISVMNSKTVVVGSTISAGGNVIIGDGNKTVVQNARKIYNAMFY